MASQTLSSPPSKRGAYLALAAAFLGWLFDGFEIGLFPVVARPALMDMLGSAGTEAAVGKWMGIITAAFLVGAALGGAAFGWLGDRIGRVKAMSFSILCYSLFSGAGYFAQAPEHLAIFRFIAALGMGGEWALGVALVMEVWPEKHRPWLAGAIGAAANLGMVIVGVIAMNVHVTVDSWRWMFLVGASPALLTFAIRLFVPESEKWEHAKAATAGEDSPLRKVLQAPILKRTLIGIVISSVALIGTWASVQWIPLWADKMTGGTVPGAKANAHMISSLGAVTGSLLAPMLLGRFSRRWGYFTLCTLSLLICGYLFRTQSAYTSHFLFTVFLTGTATAAFYGFFPLYLPELFPTAVRATGQGLCYNAGRLIAAVGALSGGALVQHYGGYAEMGATITLVYAIGMIFIWLAPETKGQPLPD